MRIITEPTVDLVGRSTVNEAALDNFLMGHGVSGWETDTECGGEKLVEVAGRACYMSFAKPRPGGNRMYLSHIKESGHGSVLEHAVWNLMFTGVSRTLTHELVRHRAGMGYSQLSQRYVDESVCEVVVPKELQEEVAAAQKMMTERDMEGATTMLGKTNTAIKKIQSGEWHEPYEVLIGLLWLNSMAQSSEYYQIFTKHLNEKVTRKKYDESEYKMHRTFEEWRSTLTTETKTAIRKDARQAARSVLPNATETKIFVTANARALRHFIEMRGSKFAEPEIRMLAYKVWLLLAKEAVNIFGDYVWELDETKFPKNVVTPFRKV